MHDLKQQILHISGVEQVRKLTYEGEELQTIVALVRDDCYTARIQRAIIEEIEIFSQGAFDWHIVDVDRVDESANIADTVWSIEVAPIHAGNPPEDVAVTME